MTTEELDRHIDDRIELRMSEIAENAADKAIEKVYSQVGKGVMNKIMWVLGVGAIVLLSWLAGRGSVHP
jgi:DNA-directed RNA polymerase beta' subunit